MKRRRFVQGAASWVSLPLVAGHAGAPKVLKLGHQFPKGSMPDRVAARMAEMVQHLSKGQLSVVVHGDAALGDEREHLALLRKGALDLAITGDLVITQLDPAYLVVNMPFLYRDAAHALATYSSDVGRMLRKNLESAGLHALSWHHVGTRTLTAQRPIANIAGLQGLKLRLPPDAAWMAVWRALGANPVPVPFNQLHTALKLGQVQAQENPPNFTRAGLLYEHQTHLMPSWHMPQRQFVFAGTHRMNSWSPQTRQWLTEASVLASTWATETAATEELRDLAWLLAPGRLQRVAFDKQGITPLLTTVARDLGGSAALQLYSRIQDLA